MEKFWQCVCYMVVISLLAHPLGQAVPRHLMRPESWLFRPRNWENSGKIYKKVGITHWKDIVPDMSRYLPDMVPKRVAGHSDHDGIVRLIQETCVAELVHWCLILLSPVIVLIWRSIWGAALMLLNILIFNLPFILIQRYNRPKLMALERRLRSRGAV